MPLLFLIIEIKALREAWKKCQYLHCDISIANIMINQEGRGVLIDWELAKKIPMDVSQIAQPTSTWHPNRTVTFN